MAFPSASTIIDLARNLIREDLGSDAPVVADTFMLPVLSEANQKWANAFNTSGDEPVAFQREFGKTLIAGTTLNAIATSASVSLTLTSSALFPTASSIIVWNNNMPDVIAYTGNNLSTQLTGVTGIGFDHAVGDEVQLIYALPTTFGSFRQSPTYGDGVQINGIPLFYMGG